MDCATVVSLSDSNQYIDSNMYYSTTMQLKRNKKIVANESP